MAAAKVVWPMDRQPTHSFKETPGGFIGNELALFMFSSLTPMPEPDIAEWQRLDAHLLVIKLIIAWKNIAAERNNNKFMGKKLKHFFKHAN